MEPQPATIVASDGRSPQVAVPVFVLKGSTVLLGRRGSPISLGTFALPGGCLEFGESFEDCTVREVREETGLEIQGLKVLNVVNDMLESSHFVTILLQRSRAYPEQKAENVKPEKCVGWGWYEWGEPSEPLFRPLEVVVRSGFSTPSMPMPSNKRPLLRPPDLPRPCTDKFSLNDPTKCGGGECRGCG